MTGLEWLVESGNDPRDYSFTTLSVGYKQLPAFRRRSCFSVGCKVTNEAYFDVYDVGV